MAESKTLYVSDLDGTLLNQNAALSEYTKNALNRLISCGINFTYSDKFWNLEVFSAEASKQNAVMFLRETYGYKKIIGFGDNYNDLPMLKVCDVRVAVNNAKDEVKAAADCICNSHDEDGVVKWIENHI